MQNMNKIALTAIALLALLVGGSCNDINKQESPVSLIVSNTQDLHRIDLAGDAVGSTNCQKSIGTVLLTSIVVQPPLLNPNPNVSLADLNQIKIDRYQVSYVRVDGGHLVPAPFVRSTSTVIAAGGSSTGTTFVVFDPNALNQAPFAALLPQNGGIDPETGKPIITMDVVLTFFGQTLAGERVSGNTRMTLDFCFSCGGCA
ncbi:MAG: hypothetical protein DMF58_00500 [Acidobacteria bacterium]|nr:MAG: hypothetical protein DMF58_00500 [Acidobacteriota bacterium]